MVGGNNPTQGIRRNGWEEYILASILWRPRQERRVWIYSSQPNAATPLTTRTCWDKWQYIVSKVLNRNRL